MINSKLNTERFIILMTNSINNYIINAKDEKNKQRRQTFQALAKENQLILKEVLGKPNESLNLKPLNDAIDQEQWQTALRISNQLNKKLIN